MEKEISECPLCQASGGLYDWTLPCCRARHAANQPSRERRRYWLNRAMADLPEHAEAMLAMATRRYEIIWQRRLALSGSPSTSSTRPGDGGSTSRAGRP